MQKKIGILGGTFNPIHIGHLILAENARSIFNLDYVYFMPNGIAYFKKDIAIAKAADRINMINLAIESNEYFMLDDRETKREGNSYTCDTIEELINEFPEDYLYYVIGEDTLYSIESWKNPEIIFKNCTIIVTKRNNTNDTSIKKQINYLKDKFNCNIELMNVNEIDISSTDIRNRINNKTSIKYLVPESVEKYIMENGIY